MSPFDGMETIFTEVFGDDAELAPEVGEPFPVSGIYVDKWNPEAAGVYKEYSSTVASLDIKKSDLPDGFVGTGHVHVDDKRYRCIDSLPDEREMVKLVLQRAGAAPA